MAKLQELLKLPEIDPCSGKVREQIAQAASELAQQTIKSRFNDIVNRVIDDINENFDHYMARVRYDLALELNGVESNSSADLKERASKFLQLKALQNDELWGAVMHISKTAIQKELKDIKYEIANSI